MGDLVCVGGDCELSVKRCMPSGFCIMVKRLWDCLVRTRREYVPVGLRISPEIHSAQRQSHNRFQKLCDPFGIRLGKV